MDDEQQNSSFRSYIIKDRATKMSTEAQVIDATRIKNSS